MKSVIGTA